MSSFNSISKGCIVHIRNNFKVRVFLFFIFSLFIQNNTKVYSQISLPTPYLTPQQAVEDVLLGVGVTAFNFKVNGNAFLANNVQPTIRKFTNTSPNFPLNEGVLLHTSGANNISDPDLSAITTNNISNGVILEFDFIPEGDTLSFSYIFTSAEYTTYTCGGYNDVFGFFISGPGINGPFTNNAINIATVPGTNVPVGINTVNSGTPSVFGNAATCAAADPNWQQNSVYFTTSYNPIYNSSGSPLSSFNGSTVELTANAKLICGETYHIKLAVTNVVDGALNSGVFLKAGSFVSEPMFEIESGNLTSTALDSVIVEGCDIGSFCFSRDQADTDSLQVMYFDLSGTATYGVDYNFINLPVGQDSLVFLPGEIQHCLEFEPVDDGILEGLETIIISTYSINTCGDTLYSESQLYIADKPEDFTPDAGIDFAVCDGGSGQLQGTAHSPLNSTEWTYTGPGTISFSPNAQAPDATITFSTPGVYNLLLTEENDTCNVFGTDAITVVYGTVDLTTSNDTLICQNGEVNLSAFGETTSGGNILYHWGHTSDTGPIQTVNPLAPTIYSVYAENEDGCVSETMEIEVGVLPPLTLTIAPDIQSICPGEEATIVSAGFDGNGGPYTYVWTDGNGMVVGNEDTLVIAPEHTTDYTVTISDGCETTPVSALATVVHDVMPEVLFSVVNPAICTPASFELINDTDPSLFDEVYWYISSGDAFVGQDTVFVDIAKPGRYDVKMTVITPNGCVESTTVNKMLTVHDKPKLSFTYYPHPTTILNTQIQFQNGTVGATTYEWSFEDGIPAYALSKNPMTKLPEGHTGQYDVELIATSEFGCTDTLMKTIHVLPEVLLFAPNSFTPDDDGFNEEWKISLSGIDIYDVTIELFNRWGEKVWESHDLNYGWNGTYGAGSERVKSGTYVWKITGKDIITDERHEWNGSVNVLR